ncbi:MAG TPA: glycogen debranching protein GlgX [Acidimicrobiales bacterium]|jgi:glycogen operon protein|nr:glycogen debranching protein GlgX [Acidimicrobiales bacterium]
MSGVSPGEAFPMGATYDGLGTNFSMFSQAAEAVELCLFKPDGTETRYELPEVDAYTWHGYIEDIEPGQLYGYRVHGPYDPARGLRCNPAKLLIDPYAKAIWGEVEWGQAPYGYDTAADDLTPDSTDSAAAMPKAIVTDTGFDWGSDVPPRRRWADTVIYETHVKGLTWRHPEVPEAHRGTFAGVAHPAVIDHLTRLGVTAIELMPVHHFIHDHRLAQLGLRNYWGYNSIAYLAPHNGYASRPGHRAVTEFKAMVRSLHRAGIEVILDVVYNHTAEGDQRGPTLAFRGIDNPSYYRLVDGNPRLYSDSTGTGNTLNVSNPHVLQLMMDSLRYWVLEMHVDGFRFDLAATLARQFHEVDRLSAFFDLIQQDPVISQVKLIAEPWDVGDGGYQVGNFPPLWSEWNGKYRDSVRDYWREGGTSIGELAERLTGSSDLYQANGRSPFASINFVTAHDGFTLQDLVSYDHKHNDDNGENGRDGTDDNRSWNCGAEGPTDDERVLQLRRVQVRNLLATLFLSQGVPMILGGDELGRTQLGNNNAYCQDTATSWYDWDHIDADLLEWTRHLIELRKSHPVFRRRRFFQGRPLRAQMTAAGLPDVAWFRPDGESMTDADWNVGYAKALGVFLNGDAIPDPDSHGRPIIDDSFFLVLNAWDQDMEFTLPGPEWGSPWELLLDTSSARPDPTGPAEHRPAGAVLPIAGRRLLLLGRPSAL